MQPRFGSSYVANAVLVVLSISPGLANGAALVSIFPAIGRELHASPLAASWLPIAGEGAIAFGGIIAAELTRYVEARRLYISTLLFSLLSSALTAVAPSLAVLVAAQFLHGIVSGFMLVIAIGPLLSGFGAAKLPLTTGILIGALFGVVSLGPLVGALAASVHEGWRILFAIELVLGAIAFWLARETLKERPPVRASDYVDAPALILGIASTVLNFIGIAFFERYSWRDPHVWLPLALGNLGLVVLFVVEARTADPLLPVGELRRAYPLVGAFACVFASGAYAGATRGVGFFLSFVQGRSALESAELLSVAAVSAVLAALLYARIIATRWGSPVALLGLLLLAAGAAAVSLFTAQTSTLEVAGALLVLSLGAGLTITPGLFTVAFGVDPHFVGRAIALLALLRMDASYLTGPVMEVFTAARTAAHLNSANLPIAETGEGLRAFISAGTVLGGFEPAVAAVLRHAFVLGSSEAFQLLALASLGASAVVVLIFRLSGVHLVDPRIRCLFSGDGIPLDSPPAFAAAHRSHKP